MTEIRRADAKVDRVQIEELFREYMEWVVTRVNEDYGHAYEVEPIVEESLAILEGLLPPGGFIWLAMEETRAAGIGCMRGLQTGTGASAVGDSATRAVVTGIVAIVVADGVFAVVYYYLGI